MGRWLWVLLLLLPLLVPALTNRFSAAASRPDSAALQVVQQALRVHGPRFNGNRADAPFCARLLGDLVAGQRVDPIPPVLETTSSTDPRLQRLTCRLPAPRLAPRTTDRPDWRYLEQRWRYVQDPTQRWRPPFRLYEVALDSSSTSGPETVLFHGARPADHTTPARPSAYTWMNVRTCSVEGEVPVGWYSDAVPYPAIPVETHLLVRNQGAVVVLDLLASPPGVRPAWLSFDATRVGPGASQHCSWSSTTSPPPSPGSAEATKLQIIAQAVRAGGDRSENGSTEPFCTGFLQDLLAGTAVEALEPAFETLDFQDPRIQKLACPFDVEDNPEVHRGGDPGSHFRTARELGHAPYRLYHTELDGNPANGAETVLYHTYAGGAGRATGYSWVDFPRCWRKRFWAMSTTRPTPGTSATDLLVRYRGQTLVLNLVTDPAGSDRTQFALSTLPMAWNQLGMCSWTFWRSSQRSGAR